MVSAGRLEAFQAAFGGMLLSLALISSNYPILLPWVSKTMSEEAPKEPPTSPPFPVPNRKKNSKNSQAFEASLRSENGPPSVKWTTGPCDYSSTSSLEFLF